MMGGNGQAIIASPGSKSMACNKGKWVNVGDPVNPSRKKNDRTKCKSEGGRVVCRKSDYPYDR